MKVAVKIQQEVTIDLNAGDKIWINIDNLDFMAQTTINRIVENTKHTYIVGNDGVWRPLSAYGKTWRKVESYD